jgi:two-component system KDP operon response regulator KdpE
VIRLLVVEDDTALVRVMTIALEARGFEVHRAGLGLAALALARTTTFDVAIVDLGLPDVDGLEVVRGLRAWSSVPVVVLSARYAQQEKVRALDAGADDYITKPFGMDELLARLRAHLRRGSQPAVSVISAGELSIDLTDRRVTRAGVVVALTPKEWSLLDVLLRSPSSPVTQRDLLEAVWGPEHADEVTYLRVYVRHLRRKLEDDPANPRHLLTAPGVGYRFDL